MATIKRYVVGPDGEGRSAILMEEPTNVQERPGVFWRSTLWAAQEVPVDNTVAADRALGITTREPPRGGMLCRALEVFPDATDKQGHIDEIKRLHTEVGQTHAPTEAELQRHPTMHRTDTLDCITCVTGEVYLMTDVDEVLMRPGDTVVIRGTNHGWSNRSDKPALLVGCMIDARH